MKKNISDFYEVLCSKYPEIGTNSYSRYHTGTDPSSLVSYFKSLSDPNFRQLISEPHWNSYPIYTCHSNKKDLNIKNFYFLINVAVGRLVYTSPKYRKTFIEKSEGIFRISTIGHTLGKEKLKAAKIGLTSRDTRLRKLAVSILPVKDLTDAVNSEKNSSVLNRLASRVGYLNMINAEKSSSQRWSRSRAFLNDKFNQDEISEIVTKLTSGKSAPIYEMDLLKKIIYHVPASELAFYLDVFNKLPNANKEYKTIFLSKMTGNSDV